MSIFTECDDCRVALRPIQSNGLAECPRCGMWNDIGAFVLLVHRINEGVSSGEKRQIPGNIEHSLTMLGLQRPADDARPEIRLVSTL